jgi:hypothetical protein
LSPLLNAADGKIESGGQSLIRPAGTKLPLIALEQDLGSHDFPRSDIPLAILAPGNALKFPPFLFRKFHDILLHNNILHDRWKNVYSFDLSKSSKQLLAALRIGGVE